ncbi:hypothetical protein F4808DRAFT_422259 [Astrocystis sublimbata]|nr:hypothetical protein F4808DRAFT_422259 [Astrocystis sublimbata]
MSGGRSYLLFTFCTVLSSLGRCVPTESKANLFGNQPSHLLQDISVNPAMAITRRGTSLTSCCVLRWPTLGQVSQMSRYDPAADYL